MKDTRLATPVLAGLLLFAVLGGCAQVLAPFLPDDGARFRALERRVTGAQFMELHFTIQSTGVHDAELRGVLEMVAGQRIALHATGLLDGQPVDLRLKADGTTLTLKGPAGSRRMRQPEGLRKALLVGLLRMGLLHNLARLAAGEPPDHMDGGVNGWIKVADVRLRAPLARGESAGRVFGFDIRVAGRPGGSAVLTLDRPGGWPILRLQEVQFKRGVMQVTERYRFD